MKTLTQEEINLIEKETGLIYGKDFKTLKDIKWNSISWTQKLSEDFIRKYQSNVNWKYISWTQKLSEKFIENFHDKVNWEYISWRQKLSEELIEKFQDKVNWNNIFQYQKLSKQFIKKYENKLRELNLTSKDLPLSVKHNCGKSNRVIRILPKTLDRIEMEGSSRTKSEAIEKIKSKYGNTQEAKDYINKVEECFREATEASNNINTLYN